MVEKYFGKKSWLKDLIGFALFFGGFVIIYTVPYIKDSPWGILVGVAVSALGGHMLGFRSGESFKRGSSESPNDDLVYPYYPYND
ncbi:hypothetical protein [Persephonella sp.]